MCTIKHLCENDKCHKCFDRSFASYKNSMILRSWSSVNDKSPRQVFKFSNKKYWFNCTKCGHKFDASLNNILGGSWCPYCSGNKLCGIESCNFCLKNSFASIDKNKLSCWELEINKIEPHQVFKFANKKYTFKCSDCCHLFDMTLNCVNKGQWCPYCNGCKLCKNDECKMCFKKSFASFKNKMILECWLKKRNQDSPRDVTLYSRKKCWFKCKKCAHSFLKQIFTITQLKTWCPFCSNTKLCDDDDCKWCFDRSFASIKDKILSCWLQNKNDKTPRQVFKYASTKKYWFRCNICYSEFNQRPCDIRQGSWCPKCKNKTEKKFYDFLLTLFKKSDIQRQPKFDWCCNPETNRYRPYDFLIISLNLLIECDGIQHFENSNFFKNNCITNQNIDFYKMKKAWKNGFQMLRFCQRDVYYDKYDWQSAIKMFFNNIDKTVNIYFLAKNKKLFNEHKQLIENHGKISFEDIDT